MHELGAAALASSGCAVYTAEAGVAQLAVFCPHGAAAPADDVLQRLAAGFASSGMLDASALHGPFVACGYDSQRTSWAVANDRFGICQVYVAADGGSLRFATDLDALVAGLPARPVLDDQAIYDYVFFHCIPAPRTIYRDIVKLGPAHCLSWSGGNPETGVYWQPQFAADGAPVPSGNALLEALEAAVREAARPPCGAFLSGGLDSSSVAGMLKRAREDAATFTIGFDAEGYDESGFARIAAEHFGTRHHAYFVTPRDVAEALPLIAAHYGEPFGNSSVVPAYYCAKFAREHGVEVMLAGDGGDELFAGNTRYTDQNVFEAWFRVPGMLRALLKGGYRLLPFMGQLPLAGKGARYIAQAEMGLPDRLQSYNFLNRFAPESVFSGEFLAGVDRSAPWALWRARYAACTAPSALQRMLYLDWKFTLADNDLVKVSHMCDLAGVEVAYPMLDERVVELACRVPPSALLRDGMLRGFYKHATRGFLPDAVIEKSKHGFGLPFGVWMQRDDGLRALAADAFDLLARRGIFDVAFLRDVQRLHGEGAAGYYGELVWILSVLALWLDAHDRRA
ncbi:MAG: asparagine synthase C-terminal domain-containing protein [Gammaproteobacteria bacterium]